MAAIMVQNAQMWQGVHEASVTIRQSRVDVTALGDQSPRYVTAGPASVEVNLRMDPESYALLSAVLATQGQYDPTSDHMVFRVAAATVSKGELASTRRQRQAPRVEPRQVRMIDLE